MIPQVPSRFAAGNGATLDCISDGRRGLCSDLSVPILWHVVPHIFGRHMEITSEGKDGLRPIGHSLVELDPTGDVTHSLVVTSLALGFTFSAGALLTFALRHVGVHLLEDVSEGLHVVSL